MTFWINIYSLADDLKPLSRAATQSCFKTDKTTDTRGQRRRGDVLTFDL